MMTRGLGVIALAVAASAAWAEAPPAAAKPTIPALVGATAVQTLTPTTGFIDDPIAFDAQRLAYVVADGSTKAELHVVVPNAPETVVDLTAITLHPLTILLLGPRAFVTGLDEHGEQLGALVELTAVSKTKPVGTIVYKVGPATHVTVITRDGKRRLALHRLDGTRHETELVSLETGKRISPIHGLDLDATDTNKKLEFHVNHWADGWTKAYGIKGGDWDPKENQRTPNVEATFDLVAGKLVDRHAIGDLFEQRKRFQVLAEATKSTAALDFVRLSWDNSTVVSWRAGKATPIELDQALGQYDPKSLQGTIEADGSTWIALKVDPVNPDAVARQKADAEYFDIFKAGLDGKATRKLRVLGVGVRYRFGVIRDKVWVMSRSNGFDRGGTAVTIYAIN